MAGELIISESNWLEVSDAAGAVAKPFQHDIYLDEMHIAGTLHIDDIGYKCRDLKIGTALTLVREPTNPFDAKAIRVETSAGDKIGYLPRANNTVYSRLMDAGKMLFARVTRKEQLNHYLNLEMEIFLRDI